MKRLEGFCKKHAVLASVLLAEALGAAAGACLVLWRILTLSNVGLVGLADSVTGFFSVSFLLGTFFIYPMVLTAIQAAGLVMGGKNARLVRLGKLFDGIVLFLGVLYTLLYASLQEICLNADWTRQLVNAQVHTPIYTQARLTVAAVALTALCGYAVLAYIPAQKLAPLVIVCSMAAMYLGVAECILWIIQIWTDVEYLPLCLAPLDFILIAAKTIRNKIGEWDPKTAEGRTYRYPFLGWCNRVLAKSQRWCAAAFVAMLPLLGILICLLVLLGQEPDAVIKAWTQSSDWNLSLQTAPQNIYYDEHYLCTVAAGGHKKIVKPVRRGVRHGHWVIVNRQLCIANAFEQILEERTPRLHRRIRQFYDTYGFPVAKAIRSPYAADLVYLLMKPLEWLFLAVLYFCDVKPENRIAVQYMGKTNYKT